MRVKSLNDEFDPENLVLANLALFVGLSSADHASAAR